MENLFLNGFHAAMTLIFYKKRDEEGLLKYLTDITKPKPKKGKTVHFKIS